MTEKKAQFFYEFKQQLVQLHQNGKRKCGIYREYDIATSLRDKWLKQSKTSGSFHEKDNRSSEQQELVEHHKRLKQLEMENDILKQAALIKASKTCLRRK